jgi:hypothetical protein
MAKIMYILLHSKAEVPKRKSQNQTKSMASGWAGGGGVQSIPEERCTCQCQHLAYNKVYLLKKHIIVNMLLQ